MRTKIVLTGDGHVKHVPTKTLRFVMNDGGRAKAGYKGYAGDCVCRSIAIASGRPYQEVYDRLAKGNAEQRKSRLDTKKGIRSARNGISVRRTWFQDYMRELGFVWHACMKIGTGCKVHLKDGEIPSTGRLVLSLSKHYSCVIDGVIHDTDDPSRDGDRCVYGYWEYKPQSDFDTSMAPVRLQVPPVIKEVEVVKPTVTLDDVKQKLAAIYKALAELTEAVSKL